MADAPPTIDQIIPGNRWTTVTPNDHAGGIWIVVFLSLSYSMLTFFTRCFIKYRMVGRDDLALLAAQILAIGQYSSIAISLSAGLGKSSGIVGPSNLERASRALYATQLLDILTLCATKLSIIFLIQRLFTRDMKNFWMICNIVTGITALWGVSSVIAVSVGCNSSHIIPQSDNQCSGHLARWKYVTALGVVLELIYVILPIYCIWDVQMDFKLKGRVVLAFAFRLPVAAFALAFLFTLGDSANAVQPIVAIATPVIWQQIEVGYSLIAATIPCLKSFIKSFDTGLGMKVNGYSDNPYGSQSNNNHSASYRMEPIKNSSSSTNSQARDPHKLRPEKLKNSTAIYSTRDKEQESASVTSGGSQEMIIRRDVQWDVRHDFVQNP